MQRTEECLLRTVVEQVASEVFVSTKPEVLTWNIRKLDANKTAYRNCAWTRHQVFK